MGKVFLLAVFIDVGLRLKPEIRSQSAHREGPSDLLRLGTHVEAESVLLQDGYTIYAS